MALALYDYDPAAALDNPEHIVLFMADAFETGDSAYIAKALGVVARTKGMAVVADETGLSREQLYRSFSKQGNPTLKTLLAVMRAVGVDMTIKAHTTHWSFWNNDCIVTKIRCTKAFYWFYGGMST